MRPATLKRFVGMPHFEEHLALHWADCLSSHGKLDNHRFCVDKLDSWEPDEIRPPKLVTGHDLIEMGLDPGPRFKTILGTIEDEQLEGRVGTREQALQFLKSSLDNGSL